MRDAANSQSRTFATLSARSVIPNAHGQTGVSHRSSQVLALYTRWTDSGANAGAISADVVVEGGRFMTAPADAYTRASMSAGNAVALSIKYLVPTRSYSGPYIGRN